MNMRRHRIPSDSIGFKHFPAGIRYPESGAVAGSAFARGGFPLAAGRRAGRARRAFPPASRAYRAVAREHSAGVARDSPERRSPTERIERSRNNEWIRLALICNAARVSIAPESQPQSHQIELFTLILLRS
ncbi:hypothetical protein [Burkholderia pseudomallei]|uniref:hypothetical protein n=1 Tax=Burkholderia pseudomallei TaxID=28450 RepID=UPI001378518E|nr:hypothetical protein [Burkholderia pseudomallei]